MPNELDGSQNQSPETPETPQTPPDANSVANAAAAAHIRRFAEKQLPAMLEAALKPIYEKMAAPVQKQDPDEDSGKGKNKITPEMQALQAQVDDFKNKFAQAEQARAAAEKRTRDEKAQNELRSSLQPHVKPELLDILTDHLYRGKGAVDFEDDGTPVFKSKKTSSWGEDEEVRLPLRAGVEQFLKSAEAKPFLPPPGTASAAPMKKPSGAPAVRSGETDPSKMNEREKIAHADRIAAEYAAKTASR